MTSSSTGSAVTAQAMPMPRTVCHGAPSAPAQPGRRSRMSAAPLPKIRGTSERERGGRAGLATIRPGRAQIELDARTPDEQHHRPPGKAVERGYDVGPEDRRMKVREGRTQHAGSSKMPPTTCTTTSGATLSARTRRQTSHGIVKMIAIASRKVSDVLRLVRHLWHPRGKRLCALPAAQSAQMHPARKGDLIALSPVRS